MCGGTTGWPYRAAANERVRGSRLLPYGAAEAVVRLGLFRVPPWPRAGG